MIARRIGKAATWIGAILMAPACGWDHLDAIAPAAEAGVGQPLDAAKDLQVPDPDGGPDWSSPEGDVAPDSATADVASAPEAASPDAAFPPLPCTGSPNVVRQWTFDLDPQSWTLATDPGVQGVLAWNGSTGYPSPGALEVDVPRGPVDAGTRNGAWARYEAMPLGDLSGRTISTWVWLDTGTSPQVKIFVQTGTQYTWADNGIAILSPHTWTCLSMLVSFPAYNGPNYAPTDVRVLGIEMRGSAPFRVYLDTVRYY